MNDLERRLIDCVCKNDLQSAKKIVKIILEQDKTQKNRAFVNRYLTMLNNSAMNLMELPADLKNLLIMEDVSVSFNEKRYYLSNREKDVVEKILKLNKASQKLAEIGVNYINSTILYGESGTGKTTFGRYIAYKMGIPFAYLNFSRVVDSYLGSTQKNISKVFDYVKQQKCVFMIDEIEDTLTSNVVLLGATNRLDIIDEALLRRFTTKHEVKRLNAQERYEMASKFLADVGFEYNEDWFISACSRDNTQAGLMNTLVEALVEKYTDDD